MTREIAIKTAAKWWADKLKERAPHSNGDTSLASIFACILADMNAEEVSDEQLKLFTEELEYQIREAMKKHDGYVLLFCDYNPCTMLRDAAETAGIKPTNFPFKTDLHINKKGPDNFIVKVSDGYAAHLEDVKSCEEDAEQLEKA